jgi:hypothetical protein
MGTFADWQPRYAEAGIATFPVLVDGETKKPAVRNYLKMGQRASSQLLLRFGEFNAFGFGLGTMSKITVLDVDTRDETIFADALKRHGTTPVIIRSGRGHHQAWYRHSGERRDTVTWRKRGYPIDVLGGGFVVAPPSRGSHGAYQFVQGGLEDLDRLPVIKGLQTPLQPAQKETKPVGKAVAEGARNTTLWRRCMVIARGCDGPSTLLELALAENAKFPAPLDDWEVEKVVNSAWRYEEQGLNWISDRHVVPVVPLSYSEVDDLMTKSPDALVLLTWLRRYNFDRNEFVIANALAPTMPGGGWPRKRLAAARTMLEKERKIVMLKAAGVGSGPATYRWATGVVNSDHQ